MLESDSEERAAPIARLLPPSRCLSAPGTDIALFLGVPPLLQEQRVACARCGQAEWARPWQPRRPTVPPLRPLPRQCATGAAQAGCCGDEAASA
eukprot:scaffold1827_cov421-Prasinococcus_capsulatus_cf.AAC.51